MKILIIGGTGLISTGITRQLVARGDEVTLYNRGQRGGDDETLARVAQIHGDRCPTLVARELHVDLGKKQENDKGDERPGE